MQQLHIPQDRINACLRLAGCWCRRRVPRVPLVALDMDGTLLDSSSNITPESAEVIRAAASAGVQVILATGKARPAAIAAARKAKLEGDTLLVSHRKPGVFLQVRPEAGDWLPACNAVHHVLHGLFPAAGMCCHTPWRASQTQLVGQRPTKWFG